MSHGCLVPRFNKTLTHCTVLHRNLPYHTTPYIIYHTIVLVYYGINVLSYVYICYSSYIKQNIFSFWKSRALKKVYFTLGSILVLKVNNAKYIIDCESWNRNITINCVFTYFPTDRGIVQKMYHSLFNKNNYLGNHSNRGCKD